MYGWRVGQVNSSEAETEIKTGNLKKKLEAEAKIEASCFYVPRGQSAETEVGNDGT